MVNQPEVYKSGHFKRFFRIAVTKRVYGTHGWVFNFEAKIRSAQHWNRKKNNDTDLNFCLIITFLGKLYPVSGEISRFIFAPVNRTLQ